MSEQTNGRSERNSGQSGTALKTKTIDEETPAPGTTTNDKGVAETGSSISRGRKRFMAVTGAAVLVAGAVFGTRQYLWAQDHVRTDDAFITGNLVNVSPRIGGTVAQILVAEGDTVRQGQLLARLEDSQQQAALRQAEAAYEAAQSHIPQARTTYAYEKAATEAAIQKARAAIETQSARTRGADAQLTLTTGTTRSQVQQAQSQLSQAQAQAAQYAAQIEAAEATVSAALQSVQTAERGVDALTARRGAAEAEMNRAQRDEERYRKLLGSEAVTQQQFDAVHAEAESARSSLANLREQIAQAKSQVAQANVSVKQARAQVAAARQAAVAARKQVDVARAGVELARANAAQIGVQSSNVAANAQQQEQSQADLAAALAGRAQVTLRQQEIETARADVRKALAALKTARVAEGDMSLHAPADGVVVRKATNPGTSVSAGQTLLTMTGGDRVWLTANFKETQLAHVRIGQTAEVEVDAFPGKRFRGVVASINAATGAATSLLPPDNATGNFTKVVQRVPVKIALVAGSGQDQATAEDIARLRQGMSSVVTIETKEHEDHPERVPTGFDRPAEGTATAARVATAAAAPAGKGER